MYVGLPSEVSAGESCTHFQGAAGDAPSTEGSLRGGDPAQRAAQAGSSGKCTRLSLYGEQAEYMDLINKGWDGMFFACEVWCVADVSSISPSLEQKIVQ